MRTIFTANRVFMSLAVIIALGFAIGFGVVVATTPVGSTRAGAEGASVTCDQTGDEQIADDCIHTVIDSVDAGQTLEPGKSFVGHLTIDKSLQGKDLIIGVQYRSVNADGTHGTWWTHKVLHWSAEATTASPSRDIVACAPGTEGHFQMQTLMIVPEGTRKVAASGDKATPAAAPALSPAGGQRVPASQYTFTAVPSVLQTVPSCQNAREDEMNVELFNQYNFDGSYEINMVPSESGSTVITLTCPTPILPIQGDLNVFMTLMDGSQKAECETPGQQSATITLPPDNQLTDERSCNSKSCTFQFFAESKSTGTIYSQTELSLIIPAMNMPSMTIPELLPATIPICNESLSQLLNGDGLSTGKLGQLSLCDGSASCTPVPASTGYSIDSTVYFEVALKNVVS